MKLPKALMEAINQVTDELEQTASGLFAPKKMTMEAEYEDHGITYKVVLVNEGGPSYLGEWDIDVTELPDELPPDDKNVTKPARKRAPRKRTAPLIR